MAKTELNANNYTMEVFEINDFTVITDFEHFVLNLESAIEKWDLCNLPNNHYDITKINLDECVWSSKTMKIAFGSRNSLDLSHYWPQFGYNKDTSAASPNETSSEIDNVVSSAEKDCNTDVLSNAAKLLRHDELDFSYGSFGVMEFLLLTPSDWNVDKVCNEDQLQTVMSGINVALSNAFCNMPVFIQFDNFTKHSYFGVCQDVSMRILFESAHLNSSLEVHRDLQGLKRMFCDKISGNVEPHELDVSCRVELTKKEDVSSIMEYSPYEELESNENFSLIDSTNLPFGTSVNTFKSITISGNFHNVFFDESRLSSIGQVEASSWDVTISVEKNFPCSMYSCLQLLIETLEAEEAKRPVRSLLSPADDNGVPLSAFSSITEPTSISITNPAGISDSRKLPTAELFRWIDCVFLKENDLSMRNSSKISSVSTQEKRCAPGMAIKMQDGSDILEVKSANETTLGDVPTCFAEQLRRCKASPVNSLTSRICIALAKVLSHHESSIFAFAELWNGIVRELREYWLNNKYLPGFNADDVPNHSTCKIHQTLQMLQCCINARNLSYKMYEQSSLECSDDEYFDAEDLTKRQESSSSVTTNSNMASNGLPQGRKRRVNALYLLNFPDVPLYEPFIQERCPMTEEMLEKYNEYLSSLPTKLRLRAHSDILFSDMEAFKAANPGCTFEDFIRWHSPRDYCVDKDTGLGCLSNRMEGTNQWTEAWNDTKPLPVFRQKRMFNESKEAESILEKLSRLTVGEVIALILPAVLKNAVFQLVCEFAPFINCGDTALPLKADLLSLCGKVVHFTKYGDADDIFDLFKQIKRLEEKITICNAVWANFVHSEHPKKKSTTDASSVREFVLQLIQNEEQNDSNEAHYALIRQGVTVVKDGPLDDDDYISSMLHSLFFAEMKDDDVKSHDSKMERRKVFRKCRFQNGVSIKRRHYVLRCLAQRPTQKSRYTPQRMYASLSGEECMLATSISISEDSIFR